MLRKSRFAIMLSFLLAVSFSTVSYAADSTDANGAKLVIQKGRILKLELIEALSSQTNRTGDVVHFKVVNDVTVDDTVVIKAGTEALGRILTAHAAKGWGKSGKLDISVETVKAVDDSNIPLTATMGEGKAWAGAKTIIGVAALGLAFGGGMKGKAVHVPKGTLIDVFVAEDRTITLKTAGTAPKEESTDAASGESSGCYKICNEKDGDEFKTCMKTCKDCTDTCTGLDGDNLLGCLTKCTTD